MFPASPLKITVAIPTYNRAEFLRQTLTGLARQNYPHDQFEVLVIDNNSRDQTRAVVAEFAGSRPAPRYLLETKQGLDHGRNRAIAEARGAIIVFADDDILVEPDWLTQISAPFGTEAGQKIGVVGGEVIPVFPDGLPEWVAEWHAPLAFRRDAGPVGATQYPMGANMAFPREVFKRVGLFHADLDRSGQSLFVWGDGELIRRVRNAGYEVWFAPAAKVLHQMPAGRTTFRYTTRQAFDSARSKVIDRTNRGQALGYLISRLPANLLKILAHVILALLSLLILRTGTMKKNLVRAWRACGYVYQTTRCLFGLRT